MNIIACQFCKKPFASLGGRICPACLEQLDRDFITVREYIYEHKSSNIDKIAEETEVSRQHIVHLIKDGRLILDNPGGDGDGLIVCEACKAPIKTGRLCEKCAEKLSSSIDRSASHSGGAGKTQAQREEEAKAFRAKFGK